LANKSAITSLTITVSVVESSGDRYNGETDSFPGGDMTERHKTSGGIITYTFVLKQGSIQARSGGTIDADFSGNGTVHPFADDTWSVVSTSGGVASTLTGSF
jgi:hypothetical protein